MPQFKEFYAEDGSSVRAYKVEEPHDVDTLTGRTTASTGEYVIERDRPEVVDVVPAKSFEEGYSENEPKDTDEDEGAEGTLPDGLKAEDADDLKGEDVPPAKVTRRK
jgi:hypothetical protein